MYRYAESKNDQPEDILKHLSSLPSRPIFRHGWIRNLLCKSHQLYVGHFVLC